MIKPIGNASFFAFFTTLDLISPNFAPKTTRFVFLADLQWNMLEDSVNMLITWDLLQPSSSEKKNFGKTSIANQLLFLVPTYV